MDLEIIILSEVSQKEKDKCHMTSFYVEPKIWHKGTSLQNRDSLTDMGNRLVVAKEGWEMHGLGVWDQQMQTFIYSIDKQQGPTI